MATPVTQSNAAAEAWTLIERLFVEHKARFFATAAEFELSPPQCMTLRLLHPDARLPMSEMAAHLHCDNSNVTGIVDRLEDRGLVERRPAEHDRRVKHVVVTERGAELRRRLVDRLESPPAGLAALQPEEQRTLAELLGRALTASG